MTDMPPLQGEDGTTDYSEDSMIRPVGTLPLTDECRHYVEWNEVPNQIKKYYAHRHDIFSLYDDGVLLTDDAWFGVTPEPVALKIASSLPWDRDQGVTTVVDLFGGVGGNAIAFALSGRWDRVICIERDAATLACAQRNAELYGVWSEVVDGAATAAVADQDEGEDEAEDADNDRGKSHGKSKGNGKDWQNSIAYDYEYGHEADTERLVGDDHDGSARLGNNGTVGWIIFVHADCFEYLRRLRVLRTLREGLHDDVGSGTASSVMQTTESATTAKNISKTARNRRRRLRNRRLAKACGLHHSLWTAPGEAVLFASPPWGGPSYANRDGNVFDLEAMEPYSLSTLSSAMAEWHHALYLPRTSDLRQIARLVDVDTDGESNEKKKIDVVQYCMNGFSKAMVAYFPARQQAAAASSGSSVRENRTTTPLSSAESSIRRQLEST